MSGCCGTHLILVTRVEIKERDVFLLITEALCWHGSLDSLCLYIQNQSGQSHLHEVSLGQVSKAILLLLLFPSFFSFFFTTVLSQWDFSHGKFGLLSPGKASCDRVVLPNLLCMLVVFSVSIIHRTVTCTTGSLMCAHMLMHIVAQGRALTP